jgi:AcrR family transcriptional regulator
MMELNAKKIHLLECAEKLFSGNGYAETSIRDIAKLASVNSAMISYYFGSKEKLVKAILDYRTTNLDELLPKLQARSTSNLEHILALTDFYIDKVFEQKNFYKLLYQLQASDNQASLIQHFNNLRHRNHDLLKSIFEAGAAAGEFNPDIDVSLITSTFTGTINHIVFNQAYYREVNDLQRMPGKKFEALLKERAKNHLRKLITAMIK